MFGCLCLHLRCIDKHDPENACIGACDLLAQSLLHSELLLAIFTSGSHDISEWDILLQPESFKYLISHDSLQIWYKHYAALCWVCRFCTLTLGGRQNALDTPSHPAVVGCLFPRCCRTWTDPCRVGRSSSPARLLQAEKWSWISSFEVLVHSLPGAEHYTLE